MVDILFSEIDGVSVGNSEDRNAMTGVTVFYFPEKAVAAVSILGGGPASRETGLADPERNVCGLDALVFAGGSSFGLEASHGVMQCLEEHGIGYDTGVAKVPLVCQSDIYDLSFGRPDVRPDKAMGYAACMDAMAGNHPLSGSTGAGTGATVGKPKGMHRAQKSGIGYSAARLGDLEIGVAAVVNSLGDVFFDGRKIAGMTDEDRNGFMDASRALLEMHVSNLFTGNTTLVALFTNGDFNVSDLKKIANVASAGMARSIRPVFTMVDGDTVYAVSVGRRKVKADVNVAGEMAAGLVEKAVRDAVLSSVMDESEFLDNVKQI